MQMLADIYTKRSLYAALGYASVGTLYYAFKYSTTPKYADMQKIDMSIVTHKEKALDIIPADVQIRISTSTLKMTCIVEWWNRIQKHQIY